MKVKSLKNTMKDYHSFLEINPEKISFEKYRELVKLFNIFVLEEKEKIIGYAIVAILYDFAEIEEFYIAPSYRGNQKGSYLCKELEAYIKNNEKTKYMRYIRLLAAANTTGKFWEKMGYSFSFRAATYNYNKKISWIWDFFVI